MSKKIIFLFIFTLILSACKTTSTSISSPTKIEKPNTREYSIQALLWQQHAGEYKALAYQAYTFAKFQLDEILAHKDSSTKPLAIVTDIDETVLDNSPFNAKMVELNEEYSSERWIEWGKKISAKPVPGSQGFFTYAKENGVEVFYISNRYDSQKEETIANLKKYNYPFADENHVLLRTETSGKEARRAMVEKTHQIVMLIGDNLSDFSLVFDDKSTQDRNAFVHDLQKKFGVTYIVLPNPMYGDWENKGIFEGKYDWTPKQKDSIMKIKLISY